ncbi:MAG: RNA polymerase sigma-70 factor [Bacteroidota bacterium]
MKIREAEYSLPDEKQLFEQAFRKYFPGLLGFALKYLPDRDDAREVVHQVFINLWERRSEIDFSEPLKSYLFTSVYNRSLNVIRDRKKLSREDRIPDRADESELSSRIETTELEQRIGESIAALPEKCREVFELSRFGGLKYSEIAAQLGISVKTVENHMNKALKILRERLIDYLTIVVWLLWKSMN